MNETPTRSTSLSASDERLLAGIAYIFGLVVALIIWAIEKDRSRFIRFHTIQAMGMDAFFLLASLLLSGCLAVLMIVVFALLAAGIFAAAQTADPTSPTFLFALVAPMGIPAIIVTPLFLLIGTVFFVRIYAAVRVFQGKDFHFPLLGKQIDHLIVAG